MGPVPGSRRPATFIVAVALVAVGCSRGSPRSVEPPSRSATPSAIISASPSSSADGAALVASLPQGCQQSVPPAEAAVAFVASGRAWAVAPDGTGLTCLFDTTDPGPFAWGPQADRVALDGLEVRGIGSTATRPSADVAPIYLSWGRPTGKAIVYSDGPKLEKALIGSDEIDDITPLQEVTFGQVAYHPSGLALAFEVSGSTGSAIWLSSNTGTDPKRLVWSKTGTVFGALAFDLGGDQLFYAARDPKGKRVVSRLLLKEGRVEQAFWEGDRDVQGVALAPPSGIPEPLGNAPPSAMALDVGIGCADRQALLSLLNGESGTPLLPDASAPTTVVGWTDPSHVVVAEGGCDGPYDLWIAQGTGTGISPVLLATGVDQGAVRLAEPTPPPPLPDLGVSSDFA